MHLIAASWLMTSLTASAALVALLLTAQSLPTFLLALPGGALADVLNRRLLIVATQCWQATVAAALAAATLADLTTPALLLTFTFALGVGAALSLPVLWAVIPELVPRAQLPAAVSLNSTSFTLAQAVGPTVGGLLVAAAGAGAVFVLNAVSFLGVAAVVASWRAPAPTSTLPAEHVGGAVRTGVRYVLNAPALQVVLMRVVPHAICFSALPALLVVVTRERLGVGAGAYGALYGCFGVGGAIGALLLPRLRTRIATDRLLPVAATVFAAMLLGLATLESVAALVPLMLVGGAASMTVLSSFSIAAQSVLPGWVRGRGLAVYLLSFQAAMAAGAALWGALAANIGVSGTLCRGRCRDDRRSPARPRSSACGSRWQTGSISRRRTGPSRDSPSSRTWARGRSGWRSSTGSRPRTRASSWPRCESYGAPGSGTAPCSGRSTRISPIRNGMWSPSWSPPGRSTSASTSAPCAPTGRRSSASWRSSGASRHGSRICSRGLLRAAPDGRSLTGTTKVE